MASDKSDSFGSIISLALTTSSGKSISSQGKPVISSNEYIDRGEDETPYEEIIRDLLLAKPEQYSFEDVSGLPWLEIDFPDDVVKARDIILPKLTNLP